MRTLSLVRSLSPALAVVLLVGASSPAAARRSKNKGNLQPAAVTETQTPSASGQAPAGQAPPGKEPAPTAVAEAQPAAAPPPAAPAPTPVPESAATPPTTAVVTPAAAAESPAPSKEATPAPGALAEIPQPAAVAPPVTEVGFERLPGSAYPEPQTRGLKYGSLWLTFHGLQWPYLPAGPKGDRFVVGLSGWGWVDTAYEKFAPWGANPTTISQSKIKYWKGQSRMLLRVSPTYSFGEDMFIQGQVELVGTGDQTIQRYDVGGADTDDLYLRFGKWNSWDITAGRFEGWEVFHLGMGLDQNTFERQGAVGQGEANYNIQFYGLTDNQFRPSSSTNLAVHYYPLNILRVELLGVAGTTNGNPSYGTRPVAIVDLGWLKLKGGVEYTHTRGLKAQSRASDTRKGVGGAIQFVFNPHVEAGFNLAQGTIVDYGDDGKQNLTGSFTRTSWGAFANFSNGSDKHPILLGLGTLWTSTTDQNNLIRATGVVDNYWLQQSYVALQYVAFKQLYIKLVGGYSRGHWQISGSTPSVTFEDEMYSVRMRFAFYF